MKTHTITTYSYDELRERAKENAINNLYDLNVMDQWWDSVYEDAKNIGLQITEFDLDRYTKGDFINSAFDTAMLIIDNHGENTETYQTAINYLEDRDCLYCGGGKGEWYIDGKLEDLDIEFLRSLCEDYYSIILQKEYEFLCSRETIEETIRVNEYEFTEDGKLY